MRRVALVFLLIASLAALAQEMPQKFRFEIKPGNITGTDEYTISKTAGGFHIDGKGSMSSPGREVQMTHSEDLDGTWQLKEYRFGARVGNDVQNVNALRKGDTITMTLDARGQLVPKDFPWQPNTIVLDNFVAAHYQVLLNEIAALKPTTTTEWNLLVPQRMGSLMAKLDAKTDAGSGTLDGKPITTTIYSLELGSSLVEVTAGPNNQLMRIQVPLQQFDSLREGFVPTAEAPSPYPAACVETPADFQSGNLKVPATLCTPKDLKPGVKFPIVVFVHGSGPHDRDETIGPNKTFKDLAEGLAASGIGSLRYDKRTFFAPKSIGPEGTVEEETIADAVAAMAVAAKEPGVDASHVYLLGHSLGGMLAPYIAERAPETHGVVLMGAGAVPLDETIERQLAAQMKATGATQEQVNTRVDQVKQQFADVRSGKLTGTAMVMGAPAHYWADLLKRDIPAELKKLDVPVLVLQGAKDIQINQQDYDLLRAGLTGKKAEFHEFPNLNHLMVSIEGDSTGAEYGKPGHVDPEVVRTIVGWVEKTK